MGIGISPPTRCGDSITTPPQVSLAKLLAKRIPPKSQTKKTKPPRRWEATLTNTGRGGANSPRIPRVIFTTRWAQKPVVNRINCNSTYRGYKPLNTHVFSAIYKGPMSLPFITIGSYMSILQVVNTSNHQILIHPRSFAAPRHQPSCAPVGKVVHLWAPVRKYFGEGKVQGIPWVVPLPSSSHHQHYHIFSKGSL